MSEIIDNITAIRKKQNISQDKLAEMTGLKKSAISKMETGEVKSPGILMVQRILKPLGYELTISPIKKDFVKEAVLLLDELDREKIENDRKEKESMIEDAIRIFGRKA